MRKIYQVPVVKALVIAPESICVGSGTQGDINNLGISNDESSTISSGSDFGVKGNNVQWED
ncbi:MAG: hypothetical protein IJ209_03700 [Bacteroidaceae bacterium]|nr:hypothetical protein [Bacteroidaceae bacterium]